MKRLRPEASSSLGRVGKLVFYIWVLLFLSHTVFTQSKGLPFITNYRYQDYNADGINWWVEEDDQGVMYFANGTGILVFDGQHWELVKPPGFPETRSLAKGTDGKIYAGTNGDIGYLAPAKNGKLEFISLKDKLPVSHRVFEEVWETQEHEGNIYFRCSNKLFIWDYKTFRVHESKDGFHVGGEVHGQYYVRIWNRGLTVLKQDSFHLVPNGEKFANERIYVLVPYDDQRILIGTRTQGLFIYDGRDFNPFKTEADSYIINTSLYGGKVLSNGFIALNTFNDGMVIIDKQGKLIQRIDKSVGLQDNSVDQVFEDSRGILWMPLFNGIAKFDLRSSLTYYNETFGLPAKTVFGVGSHQNHIYAGTNNGIYLLNETTNRFEKIEGSSGQAGNSIKNGNDFLVAGAERGLLKLENGKAESIIPGVNYNFHVGQILRSTLDTTIIYCDLRSGLAMVRYNPVHGTYTIEAFQENLSSTNGIFHETKNGNLWIAGDNIGELKLVKPDRTGSKLTVSSESVKVFNSTQGLPNKNIIILQYDGTTYFVSENDSFFVFDELQERFLLDTSVFLKNYFDKNADITGLSSTDLQGRIWANMGTGVFVKLPTQDGSLKIIDAPFKELRKNYPVWNIALSADQNNEVVAWLSGREGIIRYDGNLDETNRDQFNSLIRGIYLNEDSVYYAGLSAPSSAGEFANDWNSIRFQFAAPFFKLENETRFSTMLEGRDKTWSEWSTQNFREFGNMPAGLYTFHVKAKNIFEVESKEAVFTFRVLPPWYATWWAYILYALLAGLVIYAIVRWRTRQLHEKHRELELMVNERTAELKQKVDELAVINSVQEGLASKLDIQAIYDLVGDKIRDVFDTQGIAITYYDRKSNFITTPYYLFKGKRITEPGFNLGKGLTSHVINTGQPLLINENAIERFKELGAIYAATEKEDTTKSWLGVPLISGGLVNGTIRLENYQRDLAYSDADVSLLQTLANSMSVALENARLFDETTRLLKETEQRTTELAIINSVQEGLASKLDIQAIYDLVGDKFRDVFDTQGIAILYYDRPSNIITTPYYLFKGQRIIEPGFELGKGLTSHIIHTGQPLLINENAPARFQELGAILAAGESYTDAAKSWLGVPLISGGLVNGAIILENYEKELAYNKTDISLLQTLANSMSVALENARLFDETNRLLKETEQRTAELSVINSIQEGLVREMDINGIYKLVGDRLCSIFTDMQTLVIRTFNHETGIEHFHYAIENGEHLDIAPQPFIWASKHLILTKKPLDIETNFEEISMQHGETAVSEGLPVKSAIFVPMVVGELVKGSISLQNVDHENAFNQSDIRLLTTLTNSMSVALENARLFDETNRLLKETEQRTAELAVINSVQEGLARELDMQGIYDLIGDRIQQLFNAQAVIIATLDLENKTEHFNYVFENNEKFKLESRPFNTLRQLLIDKKQFIYISTKEQARTEFGLTAIAGTQMPKSLLFVPLLSGQIIRGYVSLQNIDIENAFSKSDIRLLETLANSMSVALENARLFDETSRLLKETEQRTAELAVINSVQDGLAKELDMRGIYNLVGDRLCELFPDSQTLVIRTFEHETGLEHWQYAKEKGARQYVHPRPFNWNSQQLILSKKPLDIKENYIETAKKYGGSGVTAGQPPKSALFVPMIVGDLVKGSISLQNVDSEFAFNESDLRLLTTLTNSMSVALENARLFDETNRLLKETEQRTAELAVINSVQEGLARELDMQGIYDLIGDRVQKLFNAQAVIIATLDLENRTEHFNYVFENDERVRLEPRPINKLRQLLVDKKHFIYISTEEQARNEYGVTAIAGTQMPKSLLFVPMLAGNIIKGYVSLQNMDIENAFSHSDIRLLETLANSMSVALENARLFDETNRLLKETEQRTAELAVINSVQDGLAKELDLQGIYDLVGDRLCELFPDTQTLVIRTFDHESGIEHFHYAIEKGERFPIDSRPFIWASKQLILDRKPILINENYLETSKKYGGTGVTKGQPPKSAVFVPMLAGDVAKGSVSLQNVDKENAFTDSDLRLLTTITNSMSVALENARLFDETTHLLSEAKQRAAELSTVNNISKALAAQLDADDLIQFVGDQLKDLFSANIVYLALLNQKTNFIDFPYQFGDVMPSRKIGDGLTSKILMNGEPLLINKDLDEQSAQMGIQRIGLNSASYLGVPIPVGDKIIGVLSVQSTEQENRFDENDLRLLSTIASSVGVALNNATLFEEVKLAKQEAEAASKLAEKANEAKSAFLSTVSHELRTPLTSVLGFAKIIKKRLEERIFPVTDKSDPKTEKAMQQVSENLNVVVSEGQRLTSLINDVLDLAKIEAGKMQWNQENVSIAEVAERAIAATTSLFDQKSLILVKEIDADLPDITGDKDKLIQVMVNLISNSVKFTPEGTVTCRVNLKEDEIHVSISDTGIGIAPKDHAAVFEQFKQVGDTLTDKPKGTGLGLPICKEIVEHHGGRIWLESELGKGSTFLFAIPVKKISVPKTVQLDDLVKQLKEQVAQSQLYIHGQAAYILIVDDDDSIRSLLQQELGDAGYQIEEARNGKEALAKVREKRPDLILLDIMMPEMNGFDVAAVLKNDPQTMDIPIIVLSIVQDKARGFKIGVDRYLNKPIDTGILFNEIGSLLEQGKSKKKVMIVDEDSATVNTLTEVLETKGYVVMESNGTELVEKVKANQPDIIIINSVLSGNQEMVKAIRFEKGMEDVLFLLYQ